MQLNTSSIPFTKMHGLGNDFVIINALNNSFDIKPAFISALANRHTGIGFDQLLIIEPSKKADFFCRIYNADGSEAEQCGNGLRCVARFIHEEKLHPSTVIQIETKAGIFSVFITDYHHIRIAMGAPLVEKNLMQLKIDDTHQVPLSVISLGNPHAILKVDSLENHLTQTLGPKISRHTFFPQGTNVGFMQIMTDDHIRLRTYERGAGETCACGSNACAAAVAGITNGWLKNKVQIDFQYGSLSVEWAGENETIYMTGPASRVFSGEVIL